MKAGLRNALLILVAAVVIGTYALTFIVDEREKALVVRFGQIQRDVNDPGLYFKVPFIDQVVYIDKRILFFESNDKRVQVVDGRRYLVDTITMFRIDNARRFREAVEANLRLARQRLETRLEAALRATYGKRSFDAALSAEREQMMREIRDDLRPNANEIGIEIVDVRIRRTDLLPEVLQSTYDRMSAERLAEAEEIRAVGTERSLTIRAQADRTAVILVSEARRDGEIIRGEGDAERNSIFAAAYNQAPEFFAFFRSLQAYRNSLRGNDTTLVLRPDSEFFEYFSSDRLMRDGGTASSAGQPGEARSAPVPPASGTDDEAGAAQ